MGWILKENVILNQWISEFYLSCVCEKFVFPFELCLIKAIWVFYGNVLFVVNKYLWTICLLECVRPKWKSSLLYLHNKFVRVEELSAQVFLKIYCAAVTNKRDMHFFLISSCKQFMSLHLGKYLLVMFFYLNGTVECDLHFDFVEKCEHFIATKPHSIGNISTRFVLSKHF